MKKFALAIVAVSALAVTAPSIASAETVVIKRGGHHHMDRGEHRGHMDRGWHRHSDRGLHRGHRNKVVVIKHGRHYD
jgi:Ni/Co efflux regulator RcnB